MTIKELKALSNKQFKRTILGDNVIENMDKMRVELEQHAKEHNLSFSEDDTTFTIDGNRVFMKPKRAKETIGTIVFRSKDYYFNDPVNGKCYGDIPKSKDIDSNGFLLRDYEDQPLIRYDLI